MPIATQCPNCRAGLTFADQQAGRLAQCQFCGASLQVPAAAAAPFNPFTAAPGGPRNPYMSPGAPPPTPWNAQPDAASQTFPPALALYIVGGLSAVYQIINLIVLIAGDRLQPPPNVNNDAERMGYYIGAFGALIVMAIGTIATLAGAVCLHKRINYPMAMFGLIVGVIPCFSPCFLLGIPFAIWGLVVINKPEIRAAFT